MSRVLLLGQLTVVAAVAVVTFTSADAWAVAAPPCVAAKVFPTAPVVPLNLPAFGYTALKAQSTDVHLFKTSGGNPTTEVPVTVDTTPVNGFLKITPTTPLVAGQAYELQYAPFCNNTPTPQGPYKFTATTASPIPTKVGTLQGTPTVTTKDLGTTQYTITAAYAIDTEMKPWAAVYQLIVVLDGKIVGTKATTLAGTDTVQVTATGWCDASNAATQQHQLQLRAQLPFAPTLDTASAPLTFNCPAPSINTPLGTNPPNASSSGGTNPVPTATGSSSSGGSSSGAVNPTNNGSSSGSTFSCAAASSHASSNAMFGLLGLFTFSALAFIRRRRSTTISVVAASRRT